MASRAIPRSFDLLDDLLESQCYRLAYWRVGSDEINYRRFFDVNDLAALAMERHEVFEAAHALVARAGWPRERSTACASTTPTDFTTRRQYLRRLQEHYRLWPAPACVFDASRHGPGWPRLAATSSRS